MITDGRRRVFGLLLATCGLAASSAAARAEEPPKSQDRPASRNDPDAPLPDPIPEPTEDEKSDPLKPKAAAAEKPRSANEAESQIRPSPPTILDPNVRPIDLNTALRLANVQNPQLMIARQRIVEAAALRQLAAVQILPTLNLGMNYDSHSGPLQQSNGNILSVQRSAVYVGSGAGAVAAGTVEVPGVVLQGNVAEGVFAYLVSRQVVRQRQFATVALRNQTFLATTLGYCELLRAEGRRAIAVQVRDEARRVAELTGAYAAAGQGRQADAHRALTELDSREADVKAAEGAILTASARLCNTLNLDPTLRLHPTDAWVVPNPIVPNPMPLCELIAIALLRRPELAERRAAIQETFLALEGAKMLPFSPTILIGLSGGGFGGGSNLVRPVFGGFGGRADADVMAYWTLRNLGVGNAAMIQVAKASLGVNRLREIAVLDQVRAEVAEAYAKTYARYSQIGIAENAVRSGVPGFREDLDRIENTIAPAIEVVDSLRLLARARYGYLDAIVDYNRAQFELYVALGQPPADTLAHPVPTNGVTAAQPRDGARRPAAERTPPPPPDDDPDEKDRKKEPKRDRDPDVTARAARR